MLLPHLRECCAAGGWLGLRDELVIVGGVAPSGSEGVCSRLGSVGVKRYLCIDLN